MSIETEFESTITNVKNAYQGLDNLGATIPQNKTIENIKSCLSEIYSNLPKTSYAEGSNITLSNTLKGKLDFEDGIVGIGDTKQNSYEGYNLLDIENTGVSTEKATYTKNTTGYTINTNSQASSSAYGRIVLDTSFVNSNDNFAFSLDITSNVTGNIIIGWVGSQMADYREITANTKIHIVRTFNGMTTTAFTIGIYAPNTTLTVENLQIYKGTTEKNYEPYTGNSPSPNPSYPQQVKCVRGRNRFNKATVTSNAYINTSGAVVTGATGYCASDWIKVSTGNIVWGATSGNGYSLSIYNSSKTFVRSVGRTNNNAMVIPIANGEEYIRFTILNADLNTMQIEEGSQATSYLPYNTLEVVERGINEINVEYPTTTAYGVTCTKNGDGTYTFNGTAERDLYFDMCYFYLPKGTHKLVGCPTGGSWATYVLYVRRQDGQPFTINDLGSGGSTEVVGNEGQLRLSVFVKSGYNCNNLLFKPMITTNTSLTYADYEPYQTPQTYQLSLGDYEFAKIGNYADTIKYDVDNDKVYKNENVFEIDKTFIVGHISSVTEITDYVRVVINLTNDYKSISTTNGLCNYFKFEASYSGQSNHFYVQNTQAFIIIDKTLLSTIDTNGVIAFFNSIPNIKIKFVLATATRTEITDTTLKQQIKNWYYAKSNTGTTIIESNGDLPMIIKCRALKAN